MADVVAGDGDGGWVRCWLAEEGRSKRNFTGNQKLAAPEPDPQLKGAGDELLRQCEGVNVDCRLCSGKRMAREGETEMSNPLEDRRREEDQKNHKKPQGRRRGRTYEETIPHSSRVLRSHSAMHDGEDSEEMADDQIVENEVPFMMMSSRIGSRELPTRIGGISSQV